MNTNPDELIKIVKRGERIPKQEFSLHESKKNIDCNHTSGWKVIVCNLVEDVCECKKCGEQTVFKCDFHDEYT